MCPTYNFECPNCGYNDEKRLLITQRNNKRCCPKCYTTMDKLIGSGGAIIFKGDGFYCNDSKKEKK